MNVLHESLTLSDLDILAQKRLIETLGASDHPSAVWRNRKRIFTKVIAISAEDVFFRASIIIGADFDIMMRCRRRLYVWGKTAAIYVSRRLFGLSYPEIGFVIGKNSWSTARDRDKKAEKLIVNDDLFRRLVVLVYLTAKKYPTPVYGKDARRFLQGAFSMDGLLFNAADQALIPLDSPDRALTYSRPNPTY